MKQCRFGSGADRAVPFRRAARVAVVALVVALTSLPGWMTSASADRQVDYDVTASADGLRFGVTAANFLVIEELADVGVPSAQAKANSSAGNQGFASNPYPGSTVISVPGLVSGQTGQAVPPYPLYVSSSHPAAPRAEKVQQGYTLRSTSDASSSESAATAGVSADPGSAGRFAANARAAVDKATGAVTATAENDIQALTINGVLQLGRVHSEAVVQASPDGKVTRSSDLSVADTKVNGVRVAITPAGVVAADQTVGLPSSDQFNEVLKNAGVQVRYLAAEEGKESVVSAGIEVTATQPDPTGTSSQEFIVRYVLGRASASAWGSAEQLPDTPGPALDVGSAGTTGNDSSASGAAVAPAGGTAPEAASGPAPAAAPPPVVAAGKAQPEQVRLLGWPSDLGALGIYVTLVFVAVAMVAGGTLVRLLGVRTRWMS